MKARACVFLVLLMLTGCSNRQVYEAIRANRMQQCQALQGAARERCMKPYDKSYDEYQRERRADQAGS